MVDALASGASVGNNVEVQVLSSAPFWEKNGNCRPLGRFFLWRRAAPASCFSGGNEIWSASKLAHFIVFGRRSRHAPRRDKIEMDTINQ